MKKMQNSQTVNNQINPGNINNNGSSTLLGMLLHRLELTGLFKGFVVRTSFGQCSSMVRSHFVLAVFSILGLVFVLSSCFSLTTARNASAASTLTVTVADTISLDIMPKSTSSTFAHSSTSIDTVTVITDNYTGYTLGIAASTANDNALSYKVNDTIVDSIASHTEAAGVSASDYADDNNASTLNNTWGYRPSIYYDATNNTNVDNTSTNLYFPAPTSTNVNTLAKTTTANPSTADNYNIAIGARVGTDKTPGAYTNTLVLTVVANTIPYTITYNANGGSNGPANEITSTYASTVNISSTVPTKTNYTFLGWCAGTSSSSNITTTAGVDSCSTTVYNPNGSGTNLSLAIDQTSPSNDNYLYAMWSLNSYTVTVNFAGTGVSSVSFTNATYGNANTVSASGGTTSLKHGVAYTITMGFDSGNSFASWATTANGTLGSTSTNPTTYTVTNSSTLTATGKVDYCSTHGTELYCQVAAMSKGTQDITALRAAIVAPDETNTISSNSGVYEYNGADSDGVNSNNEKETIYYYRGILNSYGHTGTYGSDGLADAYPNYVILDANGTKDTSDTCWRIVRTTGSGGVKMIYNGKWTGSTCANSLSSANAVSSIYFNRGTTSSTNNYETKGRIAYVGYSYNQDYGYGGSGQSESGSIANSTLFSNGTSSYIKTQVESWYTSNLTAYTSILETSAGYCSDRTTYTGTTTNTLTDSTVPYKTSSATVNFGAYIRNATTNSQPSLNCPNTTGYDLLTTSNGLNYPVALITADEAALAGSGYSTSTTPSHLNSYLRSGGNFWLLSPNYRLSGGNVVVFHLSSSGFLGNGSVSGATGMSVRPAISLASGTTATSGSGIATDPWVVIAP